MRVIAGPCQHENLAHSLKIAEHCARVCSRHGVEYFFKASYDKANRSSALGVRGRGIEQTMYDFTSMKEQMPGIRILTDIHERQHIDYIMTKWRDSVDVLQIPAFLCRQTDLVQAACDTGKIVNIKKGQFLAPWDVAGILTKTQGEVWITERGTSFGYNTLVVDFTGIDYMLNHYDVPIVFDVTHAVQKPGGNGMSSGGNRDYVPGLTRAAAALGVRNFFMEVHDDPDQAPSDGANMLRLDDFESVIGAMVRHANA
jgi:2-dehydro-3-deoxyphosphooctonate aldolase (KDO 8-P synthase)